MESPQGKKRRRPNSGPLKLETFANAKASKYNIKELKRKHEFIQNAQKVRKFRKQLKTSEAPIPDTASEDPPQPIDPKDDGQPDRQNPAGEISQRHQLYETVPKRRNVENEGGDVVLPRNGKHRRLSQVERLKREAEAKRAAQEAERLERLRDIERRRKEKEAAERARKQTFAKMHKKTARGQPVMKHRMEHLLEKLQKDQG